MILIKKDRKSNRVETHNHASLLYINPFILRIKIPSDIVTIEPVVVINTIFAAKSVSQSSAFAKIKLVTAVGTAKSM